MDTYIGLDLGTSSVKATAIDDNGKILAVCAKNLPLITAKPDFAEQDPTVWWESAEELLHSLSKQIDMKKVRGIGLSGQMHGLVLYDKSFTLLGNAIVWLDQRSQKQVTVLKKMIGEKKLYKITGNPLFTGLFIASLLWIKEHNKKLYKNIHRISSPKDYLTYKLTGVLRTEPTDALATGVYDYEKNTWSEYMLKKTGISSNIFPAIKPTNIKYGFVTAELAKKIGLSDNVPVFGGSDQSMAAMGIGLIKENQASIAISTGGQLLVVGRKGKTDTKQRLHTLHHAVDHSNLYQGATLAAGLSLGWFKNNLFGKDATFEELLADVTKEPTAINNLFFLPFIAGERTPYFNPDIKGAFIGLTLSHTKKDFVKAVLEGVGFSMRACLDIFTEMGISIDKIILSGGGTKHTIWADILANILGIPIEVITIEDHSPYGAAVFAKFAQEDFQQLEEFYKKVIIPVRVIVPNKKFIAVYNELFNQYKKHAEYMQQSSRSI